MINIFLCKFNESKEEKEEEGKKAQQWNVVFLDERQHVIIFCRRLNAPNLFVTAMRRKHNDNLIALNWSYLEMDGISSVELARIVFHTPNSQWNE